MKITVMHVATEKIDKLQIVNGTGACGPDEVDEIKIIATSGKTPFGGVDLTEDIASVLKSPENFELGIYDISDQIKTIVAKKYYLKKYQDIAEKNSYKPGWVFFQIKNQFGYEIAAKICKSEEK